MRVPIAWLREFVDLPSDAQTIADRLAMLGFPVEDIERRPSISGVVVGTIAALEKHPNADRLQIGQIDIGGETALTIATAATNVAAGQVIPVAIVGAKLPHLTIEPRKMRGVASEGMMISAQELALPAEWFEDGIMQLEPGIAPGTDVVQLFGLSEAILEVEVTTNRVDAMSILGLARELAASYGVPLRAPSFENPGTAREGPGEAPTVSIESADCTHFVAQRIDGLRVGPAPAWMRVRLALAGQRPINNVVDVSNYVMLETGQPLHFYDAARIAGNQLIVRDGRDAEALVTLDGVERRLTPAVLTIADADHALGLAGLMGGLDSEVTQSTTSILLEAANFNGARIRRTAKALGMRSEASSRHEKALAPALADAGAARAAALLTAMGATAYAPHAFGAPLEPAAPISLRILDVERLLGLKISGERITAHLEALGFAVERAGDAAFAVTPPAWRRDVGVTADLVEEIARMEGYDNIEAVVPSVPSHDVTSRQYDFENELAQAVVSVGYREIITYSLHGQDTFDRAERLGLVPSHRAVEVRNPLSEDQRFLRSSLGSGLIAYFASVDAPIRVFEIGHVFNCDDGPVNESSTLTFGFTAEPLDEPDWRDSHFLALKGDCEAIVRKVTGRYAEAGRDVGNGLHPGITGMLMMNGREIAKFGRVDPRLAKAYDLRLPAYLCNVYLDDVPDYTVPTYKPPSKFPSTYRDLALIVDLTVNAGDVERTIAAALGRIGTRVRVFDEYRGPQVGEKRKSLAVRMCLQRFDATITDAEADEAAARALAAVRDELGATIRE